MNRWKKLSGRGKRSPPNGPSLIRYFDYPIDDGFYYFEHDPDTGLNRERPNQRQNRPLDAEVECSYGFSRLFHKLMFEPGKKLYGVMKGLCGKVQGTKMEGIFHKLEHLTKVLLFDCKDCGDCALIDVAYLCPMSQCPKNQRNGACGGSFQGWCEVYPGKKTVHLCPGLCPIEETRGGSATDQRHCSALQLGSLSNLILDQLLSRERSYLQKTIMIYSLKIITGYSRSTGRGRLAQMDRALASEAIGREFESLIAHQAIIR